MTGRVRFIQTLFYIGFAVVWVKLFYWQVIKAGDLHRTAESQYTDIITILAPRGQILSSNGSPLVTNTNLYSLFIDPGIFHPSAGEWERIRSVLASTENAKIYNPASHWELLTDLVSLEDKRLIEAMSLPGIFYTPKIIRNYPEGSASAYLTGFVADDGMGDKKGYFGLEGFYDRQLKGRNGKIIRESDVYRSPILGGFEDVNPAVPGWDLITTIDRTVQYFALKHLSAGLEKYQAQAGSVSIIESKTGKVLSMISLPGYEPEKFSRYPTELFKNPVISESYEPGSTFKPVIMASALDAGVISLNSICTACSGPVTISNQVIRNWNDQYHPDSTMPEIILHSDNIGMVFVSRKLGRHQILNYIKKFGFGKKTGIDLQEEDSPEIRSDNQWQEIDWATAAFGQGIAVTRLQLLLAVNALANKGWYIPPRIVTGFKTFSSQKIVPETKPVRVVSEKAASEVVRMMVNGVENGEVRYYRTKGFIVAGKTGTAQVPIAGHYDPDESIASFVGFAPADNPKFTMLVTLKNPQSSPWGSTTAAPLWFSIAADLFRYYHLPPNN